MKEELRLKAINRIRETTPVLKDRSDTEIMAMCLVRVRDYVAGATEATKELQEKNKELNIKVDRLESYCDAYNYSQRTYQEEIKDLKAEIEKMKWHKVADGDLPKDRHNVYVVYLNGYYQIEKTIASFRHKYWVFNGLKTECEIIAWCELPKYTGDKRK